MDWKGLDLSRGQFDAQGEHAAVDFTTHEQRARFFFDRGAEGGHRPVQELGQALADLVAVAVDRLLAEQDEIRFFGIDDGLQR